jgi:hypothetical protein
MFTEVVSYEVAEAELTAWVGRKKMLPSRFNSAKELFPILIEPIQYGLVIIGTDGSITQRMIEPVCDNNGVPVLTELKYKARVTPTEQNNAYAQLRDKSVEAKTMATLCLLTGQIPAMINKLENQDRQIADAISLFFTI